MILLDTDVVSELMRPKPHPALLHWMASQPAATLHVTTVSYAEILLGIALMADGKRRQQLAEVAEGMFAEDFAGRILGFDAAAAPAYAAIVARRQQGGTRIDVVDGIVAAIAQTQGATIASRDRDFAGCGVPVVNPWQAS